MLGNRNIAGGILCLVLLGCAGSLRHVETDDPLKTGAVADVPKDVVEKFAVHDSNDPAPVPSPSPMPSPSPTVTPRSKKSRKAKAVKAQAPVPADVPLVYPNRRPPHEIFWEGERLVYELTYLGTSAADLSMEILPFKYVGGRKVYHFQARLRTSSLYSLFYRLDDLMETYMDYEGFFSHRFRILQDETSQKRDGLELNDSEKRETYYWNRWTPGPGKPGSPREEKVHAPIKPFSQDWLSLILYIRSQSLKVGDELTVPLISEGKMTIAKFSVLRRDSVTTELGDFDAVVVRADEIATDGVVKKAGENYFWLTDDERHFLIKAELRVKIGSAFVKIKSISPGTAP